MPLNDRILIVDDNAAIHEDFRKILCDGDSGQDLASARAALFDVTASVASTAQFSLTSAFQGQEALALLHEATRTEHPFSMAFVDMRMPPGWDGLETIAQLWQVAPDMQIVICTAFSDHSWDEIARRFGDTDSLLVLQKPFQSIEVIQLARNLTHKWLLTRQARARTETLQQLVEVKTEELTQVNTILRETIVELEQSNTKILRQNEELHRLATRDPLTGCLNRRAFFSQVEAAFQAARDRAQPCGCLMLDIDHFKRFNDHYGHAIGDQVLAVVAAHTSATLRPSDILGRYGGEEFCAFLPGANMQVCEQVAERLRLAIALQSGMAIRSIGNLHITASIGTSSSELGGTEIQHLINQADKALYAAKRTGRNRVVSYDRLGVVEGTTVSSDTPPSGR